jgi:MSHA biogenesis protein MshQ
MMPRFLKAVLFCGLLLSQAALAQSQTRSPTAAGDCTNQAGTGAVAWSNAGDAISSNGSYANASLNPGNPTTNYLRCLNYGFSIPGGSTILGIEVHVERKSSRTGSSDAAMRLVKGGVIQSTDRSTTAIYDTTDEIDPHGGAADLWGTTWTPAEINAADFGAAFASLRTGGGPPHDITVDHISITVHYSQPTPGSFNAFETATAPGAITGVIRTKVSGTAFSLDVVAILSGAQFGGFTNTVIVELLGNNTVGVPLDANNCPTSFALVQTVSPNPTITNGRSTVSFAAVANSWRDLRIRVRYPTVSPTVTGCSTDNFAIRPASLSVAAADADWQSAGGARTLNNTGAAGGVVHKAGRSFRLQVTPSPGTATNYDGSPTVSALACSLPAPCANGVLAVGAFGGTGTRVSDTATYSEAGAFSLTMVDQTYAGVDAADTAGDCSATGRYVCQSPAPASIGRFVPDRFALTATAQPVFRTFDTTDASCSAPPAGPRRSFTYVGQPFGYATAPSATVVAQNAAGTTTTNYRGALWKLTPAGITQSVANSPVLALDASQITAPALAETPDTGTGTLTGNAANKLAFVRNAAVASAPFAANLALTWDIADASEAGAGQGTIGTAAVLVFDGGGAGVGFDSGAELRYGRLRLTNANGSQLVPLPLPMEAQYWAGAAGFVTNVADNCTTVATASIGLGTYTGNLAAGETALSGGGTLTAGRRTLLLSAPGSANDGSVILTANLGATHSYLQGNWTGAAYDDNPTARATFGTFKGAGEVIFMRENF